MDCVYKLGELDIGTYEVLEYDLRESIYGQTYIITACNINNDQIYKFWSTKYLTTYIKTEKPTKKFEIEIISLNGIINGIQIKGYSRKTILT